MSDTPSSGRQPRRTAMNGGVMLIVGILVGVAVAAAAGIQLLGLGVVRPEEAANVIHPSPVATQEPTEPPSPSGDVPAECVEAARYAIAVDESVDSLAAGAQAEDARELQEALGAMQDARDDASGAPEACLAAAGETP